MRRSRVFREIVARCAHCEHFCVAADKPPELNPRSLTSIPGSHRSAFSRNSFRRTVSGKASPRVGLPSYSIASRPKKRPVSIVDDLRDRAAAAGSASRSE